MAAPTDNIIQHWRTAISNNPPVANSLLDGQLSLEQSNPMRIWMGVPVTVDPTGRRLLYDASELGGVPEAPLGGLAYARVGASGGSWQPALMLAGGNVSGPATFSAIGTGIAVINNVTIGGTLIVTGALTLGGDPAAPLQAATRRYVDAVSTQLTNYVPLSGAVMTGLLTLSGPPTALLHAATKTYTDTMDLLRVLKSGDTMSGSLTMTPPSGIRFSQVGTNPDDVTTGIQMYPGFGGFTVTSSTLNITWTNGNINIRTGGAGTMLNALQFTPTTITAGMAISLPGNVTQALQAVPLQQLQTYLPLTGGQLSGLLTIANVAANPNGSLLITGNTANSIHIVAPPGASDWPTVTMDSPPGLANAWFSNRGGHSRWSMQLGSTEQESGGNAGSNFYINRFTDTGQVLDAGAGYCFLINRASGLVQIANSLSIGVSLSVAGTVNQPFSLSRNPANPLEAATKQYADLMVPLAGGIMTGFLTLSGDPQQPLHAATREYVDQRVANADQVSITGDGSPGNPFKLVPALASTIATGTDNRIGITSLGLRSQMGADAGTLLTAAKTVVPSINEILQDVRAIIGIDVLIGTYDVPHDNIILSLGSPSPAGPLPVATLANKGWYVIVQYPGFGIGNAPHEDIAEADWLISTGVSWLHFVMNIAITEADGVAITAISGLTAQNVQDALAQLQLNKLDRGATDTLYLPLTGGLLTGPVEFQNNVNGIEYLVTLGQSRYTAFGFDGTYTHAWIDGIDRGALATQAWTAANYLNLTGGSVTGLVNFSDAASRAPIAWGGNTTAAPVAAGGGALGWNYSAGNGETDFFNRYAGSQAFMWWAYSGSGTVYNAIMSLSQTGTLIPTAGVNIPVSQALVFGSGANSASMYVQTDGHWIWQSTNSSGATRILAAFYTDSSTSSFEFSVPVQMDAGATVTGGGLHFGSQVASSPSDLTKHIDLWGGQYGFSITGGTVNYNSGGAHNFYGVGGPLDFSIQNAGITAYAPLNTNTGITASAAGQWSSFNLSKSLLITASGANPAIGIADSTGINLVGIVNSTGTLSIMGMPAYSNSTTPPVDRLDIGSTGIIAYVPATINGGLTVVNQYLNLVAASATIRALQFFSDPANPSGSAHRWSVGVMADGEGGTNTGSSFFIGGYTDSGGLINYPIQITRASGLVTVVGNPQALLGIATKQYVDTAPPLGGPYFPINISAGVAIRSTITDPIELIVPSGANSRFTYLVTGVRQWGAGVISDGSFRITDENAPVDNLILLAGGGAQINGGLTMLGSSQITLNNGDSNAGVNHFTQMVFSYSGGGYSHWLATRHDATPNSYGNAFDFYLCDSTGSDVFPANALWGGAFTRYGLSIPVGAATAPSLNFANNTMSGNPTLGLYQYNSTTIGIAGGLYTSGGVTILGTLNTAAIIATGITASAVIKAPYTGVTSALGGAQWGAQGGYIGWNYNVGTGFNGGTDFINSHGLGSGGFAWYDTVSASGAVPVLLATLNASGGWTMTGAITLPGIPTAPNQAATKQYVDTHTGTALPLVGGTMTGPIVLAGNAAAPLQAVPLQQVNSVAANYLPLVGGTLSGGLAIVTANASIALTSPSGYASINLTAVAGQGRQLLGYVGSNLRWVETLGDATAEGTVGSNVGSNYSISRYTDAGAFIDSPISINRASGLLTTNGLTSNAAITAATTMQSNNGRIIAFASSNPGFCCYNSGGYAAGMFASGTTNLYFGGMDGNGNYVGPAYGWFDRSGNFWSAAATTATYLHSTGSLQVDGGAQVNGYLSAQGSIMNATGVFYVANNQAYYLARNASDGAWRFVEGGTVNSTLDTGGNFTARGQVSGGSFSCGGYSYFADLRCAIGGVYYNDYGHRVGFGWNGWLTVYVDGGYQYQAASTDWVNNNFKNIGAYTANQNVDVNSNPTFWVVYHNGGIQNNGGDIVQNAGAIYTAGGADLHVRSWGIRYDAWNGNDTVGFLSYGREEIIINGQNHGTLAYTSDVCDIRSKNVIGNYQVGLAELLQLRPIRYVHKGNTVIFPGPPAPREHPQLGVSREPNRRYDGIVHVGLVAQEAEVVMPELVTRSAGIIDGEDVDDVREVNGGPLIFAVLNALKEINARLLALEGK